MRKQAPPSSGTGDWPDVEHPTERLSVTQAVGREPKPIEGENVQNTGLLPKQNEGGIREVHGSVRVFPHERHGLSELSGLRTVVDARCGQTDEFGEKLGALPADRNEMYRLGD